MKKITVVGTGNVGATCLNEIARRDLCEELVAVDINEGATRGKALDMQQTAPIFGFNTRIVGAGNDYSQSAGSGIVVITAGLSRKPGRSYFDECENHEGCCHEPYEILAGYDNYRGYESVGCDDIRSVARE